MKTWADCQIGSVVKAVIKADSVTRKKQIMRTKMLFVSSIITVAAFLGMWYHWYAPYWNFEQLLKGDEGVEIASLTLKGHGRIIKLDDVATMKYLTRSFRSASKEQPINTHGYTYYAYINIGSNFSVMAACDVPSETDGVNIAFPYYSVDDPTYYWISFSQPIPPALSAAITQMRQPSDNGER